MHRAIVTVLVFVTTSVAYGVAPCAATPGAALQAYEAKGLSGEGTGYRVLKLRTDASLGVTWADLQRCDHPEWPVTTMLAAHPIAAAVTFAVAGIVPPRVIAVHPGETVKVWRNETNAHLEMAAISDESGAVGERIRLHVATASGEPVRICYGIVRGPANVELES